MNRNQIAFKGLPKEFQSVGRQLFESLDFDGDGVMTAKDLDVMKGWNEDEVDEMDRILDERVVDLDLYFKDVEIAEENAAAAAAQAAAVNVAAAGGKSDGGMSVNGDSTTDAKDSSTQTDHTDKLRDEF